MSSSLLFVLKLSTKVTKRFIKLSSPTMSEYSRHYTSTPWFEPKLESVKTIFRKYEGGQVSLTQDEQSGIAYIGIEHEPKKNSLSGKMMVEFHEAVEKLETWETGKGLILHSPGETFCSGGYLETIKKLDEPEKGLMMACLMHDAVNRLRNLPLVSVAVVQGKALGGGAELLLCTDFRLLTPKTEIIYVQAKMGISTGWCGGQFLKNLVGHNKALDFLLTGRKINSDEALKTGLADGVVQHETRLEESVAWLNSRIGGYDAKVVRANKLTLTSSSPAQERQVVCTVWAGESQKNQLASSLKHS